MAESARLLAEDVFGPRPVRQWVLSFPFLLRFLFASRPESIGPVLAIVYRVIAGWLADEAGIPRASAQSGAVTLIQRFGSARNLNVHFHMLFLDGVYDAREEHHLCLHRTPAPTPAQMTSLAATIARRVCRHLEKRGYLESEGEGDGPYLSTSACREDGLDAVRMHAITYRIATGPHAGRKVTTVQTLPVDDDPFGSEAGRASGFSLHAGVAAQAHEGDKLERLCRYISRPALSEKRLSLTAQGRVSYHLKTPWRDGTTHVEFEPVEFLARLAALVPPPRAHLTRFHGVFAPNARLRAQLTPAGRGKRAADSEGRAAAPPEERTPEEQRRAMTWMQRLKRVFGIDIEKCLHCGGVVRILASVEEPDAIGKILAHFGKQGALPHAYYQPATRGPPAGAPVVAVT